MTTAEIKILQCLRDRLNMNYIARNIDGALFAFKHTPTLDPIERTWNEYNGCTYLCDIAYERLDLDYDLDINIKDVTFDNLSSTTGLYCIDTLLNSESEEK